MIAIDGTDLLLSRISFGTGSLHHQFRASARRRLLGAALEAGVSHFDTAPYYGEGLAEHDLGRLSTNERNAMTVATKIGLYPAAAPVGSSARLWARRLLGKVSGRASGPRADFALAAARESFERSLRVLRRDRIDLLMLHEPVIADVPSESLLEWLHEMKVRGSLRAWGVAGVAERVEPFVATRSGLAQVVQTRDSVARREALFLSRYGRPLQITYGYFSSGCADIASALSCNTTGTVIFSTRRLERVAQLAAVVRAGGLP
jgi:aryl-alcohol dehydrogenase-like predicted oxidoreductase